MHNKVLKREEFTFIMFDEIQRNATQCNAGQKSSKLTNTFYSHYNPFHILQKIHAINIIFYTKIASKFFDESVQLCQIDMSNMSTTKFSIIRATIAEQAVSDLRFPCNDETAWFGGLRGQEESGSTGRFSQLQISTM